jgi:hypothetical protein
MTADGGLVVFEAKAAQGDPPLIAIMEGLDYLAWLIRQRNFEKIENGFQKWKAKRRLPPPSGFENTSPDRTVRPTLVVLAPPDYFGERNTRSIRGRDWPLLLEFGDSLIQSVRLAFATTDFSCLDLQTPRVPKSKTANIRRASKT